MLRTSRLIRSAAVVIAALLVLSACGSSATESWARETAADVCGWNARTGTESAVAEYDGETVLVTGNVWNNDDIDDLGLARIEGDEPVPGLDPVTDTYPDKVLCLVSRSTQELECPDGRLVDGRSLKISAVLHSIALGAEIATTEVHASQPCRDTPVGEIALAQNSYGNAEPADVYDIDQVFCDLLACVLDDDVSAMLTAQRADDPRSEVCDFAGPFDDGIIQLEDGAVYVAHELGYRDALADATPALDVSSDRTLCLQAEPSSDRVSCGEYYFEGQFIGGVEIPQTGVDVRASWFAGDDTTPSATTAVAYHSECTDEISVMTTTYGSTSIGGRSSLENRVETGTLTSEHVAWVAEDLQQWAEVNAGAADISANDCSVIAGVGELASLQRKLDGYDDHMEGLITTSPQGLSTDIERLQNATSDLFSDIDEDSPLFTPVFELWYTAHFTWPLIDTFVHPDDPDVIDEDLELTMMGMPARVGAVSMSDPAFVTRHETVELLAQIHADHC